MFDKIDKFKEIYRKRLKLKSIISFVADYMVNVKNDAPLKITLMLVMYLLQRDFNFELTQFVCYLYPYSQVIDIIIDELKDEVLYFKEFLDEDDKPHYLIIRVELPEKYIDVIEDQKDKIINAIDNIYLKYSNENGKLSLDKLLKDIYENDKIYNDTPFCEVLPI